MSSVNMTLQGNTSCELALNKFNLPIEAFTKSYLKDLKPALKFRREKIRAKKELDKCVALIFRSDEKRKAKAAKLAAKRAAILKKIDDTGYGIVFDRTQSTEYLKKILKDIPELRRADKEYDMRMAREAKAAAVVKKMSANLKKKSLTLLKWAEKNGFTLKDIVAELKNTD